MGIFGNLFGGGEKELPPLEASNPSAARLERNRATLEGFAKRVQDKLEIVPGERGLYIFVGKPPKTFGIVWFHDGVEQNFRLLMKEKGLSAASVQTLSDQLREAYTRTQGEPRYAYDLAGRKVVVTPSAELQRDVAQIIGSIAG
jgi:hypothetical protein